VAGNEIAFTNQGSFNSSRTTLYFTTVNGAWKSSRGAASTIEFHLNDDYSSWYRSIENNYKQPGGTNYSRIRWGDSVFAQNQALASDGLLVSKVLASGLSTKITAAGRSVTLGGDLLVDLYDYNPAKGRHFDLNTAGQITSSFNRVLFRQPPSEHSAVVSLVDTDAGTVADTLRLTVGSDNVAPNGTVTISGTPTQGQTLTAANTLADADGIPSSGSGAIAYQWKANGTAIAGATGSTFVLTQAEVGKSITVTASYTDNGGTPESMSSAATSAVANLDDAATATLAVTGTAQEGGSLTAALSGASDPDGAINSTTFQWQELISSTWTDLAGANTAILSIPAGQSYVGKQVRVVATTTDALGGTTSFPSAGQTIANLDTVAPVFSSGGTAAVNENVAAGSVVYTAAATDSDFNSPATASSITYSLSGTDAAAFSINTTTGVVTINASPNFETKASYAFSVVATDAAGNTASQAVALAVSNVNEAPIVAAPLSDQNTTEDAPFSFTVPAGAFSDVDAGTTLTYTATRADGSALPTWLTFNTTTRSFSGTPGNGDVGTVNVTVTASDGSLSASETFAIAVANSNAAPTGTITISGTPTQGQTLTVINTLADGDGIPNSGARRLSGKKSTRGAALSTSHILLDWGD